MIKTDYKKGTSNWRSRVVKIHVFGDSCNSNFESLQKLLYVMVDLILQK